MSQNKGFDVKALMKEMELFDNPVSEKQRDILKAAELVFGEKGYDAAPTAEIARRAGVTERTLFKHFRTKADLLKRVVFAFAMKTFLPAQIRQVNTVTQQEFASYSDFVRTLALDRLHVLRSHGFGPKIVFFEIFKNDDFRAQLKNIWKTQVWGTVVQRVKRFQEQGKLRKDAKPESIARATVAVVAGYVFFRAFITPEEKWDDEKEIESLAKLLFEGVGPRS